MDQYRVYPPVFYAENRSCFPSADGFKSKPDHLCKEDGFKRILLKIVGIRNIVLFQYIGAHLTNRDYDKKLSIIAWRNEQAQT